MTQGMNWPTTKALAIARYRPMLVLCSLDRIMRVCLPRPTGLSTLGTKLYLLSIITPRCLIDSCRWIVIK